MRRGTKATLAIGMLALAAGAVRADVAFTKVWEKLSDASMSGPRSMGYDPVSDTMVLPDTASPYNVHAFNASTGAAKPNLSTTGITTGGLGWFALTAATNGKVYGYNDQTGGLTVWQSPSDPAPTEVTWSGAFSRNLYAVVNTTGTRIYSVGTADGGPIYANDQAPNPADGFVLAETIGGRTDTGYSGGKAGVTANAAGTLVFGSEAVSGPPDDGIHMWTKVAGTWTYQGDLLFPTQFPTSGIPYAMDVTIDEPHHLLFGIERVNNSIFAIDLGNPLVYGDETFMGSYTVNSDMTYYGSIAVDPAKQTVYWTGRNTDTTTSYGSLHYVVRAPGDANGDGKINGDDYTLIDRAFAKGGQTGWTNGDFNGDGTIDSADYLILDTAYGKATGQIPSSLLAEREAEFGAGYVAALTAAVPEPALLGAMALPLVLGLRRRRA